MTLSTMVIVSIVWNGVMSSVIVWSTVCTLNAMDRRTGFWRRLAYVMMGTGALASVLAPLYLQRPPTATELLLVTAVSILRVLDMAGILASSQPHSRLSR